MKKNNLNQFLEKAISFNLKIMGLTGSKTGYPEPDMGYFIHGFKNINEAKSFINEVGGELIIAEWKAGWNYAHFVDKTNSTLPEPQPEFYGNDYIIIKSPISINDFSDFLGYKDKKEMMENEEENYIKEKKEKFLSLINDINSLVNFNENEIALVQNWEFIQTLSKNPMYFENQDTYMLAVGVGYLF